MSRVKNKLTVKQVDALKLKGYYSDGGNLYLQVSQSITKSWIFRYVTNNQKHEIGLGPYPEVPLTDARAKASEARKQLSQGIDPLEQKKALLHNAKLAKAKLLTFKQCAETYITSHAPEWKNPKHIQQWRNTLTTYVYPLIGDTYVKDIDTGLVSQCLEPIWLTKNETAGRIRGRIESILDWATAHNYREGENPARWRGHLDKLFAKPSKVQKTSHHNALPYTEIGAFMARLQHEKSTAARCLEFTILNAVRTNESIGATWDEIDMHNKVWTIPAIRMKAEKEHRVPLSDYAIKILCAMAAVKTNPFVFAGTQKGLSNMAMLQLLKRMGRADITVHGFRSTFRDWSAETTAHPSDVVEMALAHTIPNKVEAAYRRGDLMEKRTVLMNDWAKYCAIA